MLPGDMTQDGGLRELVLVIGAGRSGTSLTAGVFHRLGFHVPQPEVEPNKTNPRGFGEPRWVVNFHAKLMLRYGVDLLDARPAAWAASAQVLDEPVELGYCRTWTGWQFDEDRRVVVKDPRTGWFLPMWIRCTAEIDVRPSFVSPLRHPSEVSASVRTTDQDKHTDATKIAWWINMMLHAEEQTRDQRRAYVAYDDLLTDWRSAMLRAERALGVDLLDTAGAQAHRAVDELVDPNLRRSGKGWEGLDVPAWLRDLAEATWDELVGLSQEDGDGEKRRATLDSLRAEYVARYRQAESVTESSINAAARAARDAAALKSAQGQPPARIRLDVARVRRAAARMLRSRPQRHR
jgi:hypothetical protein